MVAGAVTNFYNKRQDTNDWLLAPVRVCQCVTGSCYYLTGGNILSFGTSPLLRSLIRSATESGRWKNFLFQNHTSCRTSSTPSRNSLQRTSNIPRYFQKVLEKILIWISSTFATSTHGDIKTLFCSNQHNVLSFQEMPLQLLHLHEDFTRKKSFAIFF